MRITQLNHVALHVADVARSRDFYARVLGLAEIPRPAFNFDGAWFRIGPEEAGQELHLIARAPKDGRPYSIPRERHWAMAVADIHEAATHLLQCDTPFEPIRPRPDGALQLYVEDPDGHRIELCQLP